MRTLAGFTPDETATLAALVDTVIPEDSAPGGWDGGVGALLELHLVDFLAWAHPLLRDAVHAADERARVRSGTAFADLAPDARAVVLTELEAEEAAKTIDTVSPGGVDLVSPKRPFETLVVVTFQGYYAGTSHPVGWEVAGFRDVPAGVRSVDPDPLPGVGVDGLTDHYDIIVIGAGAGGGVAAAEFADAGWRVLLVERARAHRAGELRGNHLQGKREQVYDVTAGPGPGNPRVFERLDGSTVVTPGDADGGAYGLVAMTLGGGTRLWQGMAWRFFPEDFRMAEIYGAPEDSTLVDWPFDYDELAPYYDEVEWELGVSGDANGALSARTPRSRDLPMPPMPDDETRIRLTASAASLGWTTTAIPFAINSTPRAGRAACVRCSQCVGHACPVDAKNGTHNTFIPRALASGNVDLLHDAQAVAIEHDGRGTATGVRLVVDSGDGSPVERVVRAGRVVVSAGALETPRLLLASGLGNDWVGRNHHSHGIAGAIASSAPAGIKSDIGPGHSVATLEFVHRAGEAWGGGVLFDLLPPYPLGRALAGRVGSGHSHGQGHKDWMRAATIPLGAMSMVQEIPHVRTRIGLDPTVRDRYGMPVVRSLGVPHPASVEATDYMAAHAAAWVEASGGRGIRSFSVPGTPQGAEHSAGTTRMGADPATAACDPRGLLYGTRNVYVADASLHPTNGGFNPALTVMANALRVARLLNQSESP